MSHESFTIAYGGPALRDHAMDVRDLAPALLAVGQLFDAANTTLNGEGSQIRVKVKATSPGSFHIDLELVQSFLTNVLQVFATQTPTGAANLLGIVLGGSTIGVMGTNSLVWLVKRMKGKPPDKVVKTDPNTIALTIDGETFTVPLELMRLYQSVAVRDALQKVVEEPLNKEGIEEFEVLNRDRQVVERVSKPEAEYFAKPDLPDETLVETVRRSAFSIVSLAFKEDNKWRLYDGNTTISASVEDEDFLRQIDQNAQFSKGDILLCDVRITQKNTRTGLKTEYVVERVVQHIPAARQLPLPLSAPPTDDTDSESSPEA